MKGQKEKGRQSERRNTMDIMKGEVPLTTVLRSMGSGKRSSRLRPTSVVSGGSTSSSSSSSGDGMPGPSPPSRKKRVKKGQHSDKLSNIQTMVVAKKERIVEHVQPKLTHVQTVLATQTKELSERAQPVVNRVAERVQPVAARVNDFLLMIILRTNACVMKSAGWLNDHLPKKVSEFFAPIPEDEKEPFKIHKPSGLSMCFFALNMALVAVGFFVFMIGLLALTSPSSLNSLSSIDPTGRLKKFNVASLLKNVAFSIFLFGMCLLGLGYLGCIGCILGQRQMLRGYAFIVGSVIGIEGAFVIFAFLFRKSIYKSFSDDFKANVKTEYDGKRNSTNGYSQLVDVVQAYFDCCGVENYTDFVGSPWYMKVNNLLPGTTIPANQARHQFPVSCCKVAAKLGDNYVLANKRCYTLPPGPNNPNTIIPCLPSFVSWMYRQLFVLAGAAFTFVGLQVSAITNAMAVVKSIDKFHAKRKKRSRRREEEGDPTNQEEKERETENQESKERLDQGSGLLKQTTMSEHAPPSTGEVEEHPALSQHQDTASERVTSATTDRKKHPELDQHQRASTSSNTHPRKLSGLQIPQSEITPLMTTEGETDGHSEHRAMERNLSDHGIDTKSKDIPVAGVQHVVTDGHPDHGRRSRDSTSSMIPASCLPISTRRKDSESRSAAPRRTSAVDQNGRGAQSDRSESVQLETGGILVVQPVRSQDNVDDCGASASESP